MSKTSEFLSDLVDDKCSSDDLDSLLNDSKTIDRWHRYSAVSEILKGEYSANATTDFCMQISSKIADEPAILAAPRPTTNSEYETKTARAEVKKLTGGFAIAASFAFATFFSVQTMQVSDDSNFSNDATADVEQISTNSDSSNNVSSNNFASVPARQSLPVDTEDSSEQIELEFFNEVFMSRARESEKDSIAPFARRVGAEYVKTLRFSAEKWQELLQKNQKNKPDSAKASDQVDAKQSEAKE